MRTPCALINLKEDTMLTHGHKHTPPKAEKHPAPKYNLSGLHRDWRTWLVIGLMLAAMGAYVITLDESVQPGAASPPAAAAPAGPAK
jgi:hypothetical protein